MRLIVFAGAAVVVAIGGCTLPGDPDPVESAASGVGTGAAGRPSPRWEQLPAPDSPTDGRLATSVTTVVGAAGEAPALLVGSTGTRPAAPRATAWSDGDTGWDPATLPGGENLSVTAAATDGTRTWLAGWRWDSATGVSAALLSSADRVSWQEEPVDGVPEGAYPTALAATDDGLVMLGRTVDEVPFAWRPDDGAESVTLPLPDGHDGRVLAAVSRADDPGAVVAVVDSGVPGRSESASSVVSDDAGRTFRPGGAVPGEEAMVSGLAAVADGVVATGWLQADGRSVPAAWLSADGVSWTLQDVVGEAGFDLSRAPGADLWLGVPTVRSGAVVVPMLVGPALAALVLERTAEGWREVDGTVPAWRAPGTSPTLAADGDELLLAQSYAGGTRVRRSAGDGWQEWSFGDVLPGPTVSELQPAPDGAVLWTDNERVAVEPDDTWSREYESLPFAVSAAGEVNSLPWPGGPEDPTVAEMAERLNGVVRTTADDGSTLVLGEVSSGTEETDTDLAGWLDSPDGSRRVVADVTGPEAASVRATAKVDGTWYAVGGTRPDTDPSSRAAAQAWRSADGVTWTPLTGDYRTGDETDSVADDVCAGPDGQVLAVGSAALDGGERAVVWRLDGDEATRVWTSAPDQDATLDACITAISGGEETLITGRVDGVATRWSTTDGTTFDASALGGIGTSFGPVRAVAGGYAAAGQTTGGDGAWTGAVVRLSRDGRTWRTLRLPAEVYTTAVDVVAVGDDLLVAGDTDAGPQLWSLTDYAGQL